MEMVIMLGVGAVVTLGVMKLTESQSKSQTTIKKNYAIISLNEQIKSILSKEENCTESFRGIPPTGSSLTSLKNKVNGTFTNVLPVNTPDTDGLTIKSYSLSNSGLSAPETNLRIDFSRGKSALKDETHKFITIRYSVDGSGNILSCYGLANNSIYWARATNEEKNIFYEGGNVGIGTNDPKVSLDVNGDMRPGPPGTCSALSIGSIAYDPTTQTIRICTATGWNSPTGAGTLTTFSASCNSTSLTQTITPLGDHKLCLLKRFDFSNMGKDDHFVGDCIVDEVSPGTWSLRARCDESRMNCEAICKD